MNTQLDGLSMVFKSGACIHITIWSFGLFLELVMTGEIFVLTKNVAQNPNQIRT